MDFIRGSKSDAGDPVGAGGWTRWKSRSSKSGAASGVLQQTREIRCSLRTVVRSFASACVIAADIRRGKPSSGDKGGGLRADVCR